MVDLYQRFKLFVEVSNNEIQTCIYVFLVTNRKRNKK